MIKPINKNKVKIKNLLGIIEDPKIEDLLFEIIFFLDSENRLNEEFSKKEINLKTKYRFNEDLSKDIRELINKGYLSQIAKRRYMLLQNLWE